MEINRIENMEKFILSNDLQELERLIHKFNIFEVTGMHNQEIRHSHVVSFFLNPSSDHGLDDFFIKNFLYLVSEKSPALNKLSLYLMDLSDCVVYREAYNIDIMIISKNNDLVIAIENKTKSSDHSNQLERYKKTTDVLYQKYKKIFVYLTVEGDEPSKQEDKINWISISYEGIISALKKSFELKKYFLREDQVLLIKNYIDFVERYILKDDEAAKLAILIYEKHREAIDFIIKNIPDKQSNYSDILKSIISTNQNAALDKSSKEYIRFTHNNWPSDGDIIKSGLQSGDNSIFFEVEISKTKFVNLCLVIGKDVIIENKEKIITYISEKLETNRQNITEWTRAWYADKRDIALEDLGSNEFEDIITNFFEHDFEKISAHVKEIMDELNSSPLTPQ